MTRRRPVEIRRGVTALIVIVAIAAVAIVTTASTGRVGGPWECVTTNSVTELQAWERTTGRPVHCAVMFIDAVSTWQQWDTPWILKDRRNDPQYDWIDWLAADRAQRHLALTIGLIPGDARAQDWLYAGASGRYAPYARTLARNLVAAGLGDTVIRLGHEANGTWYPDSVPATPAGDREWVRFWDRTVTAMRSVPGAHFRFDWTVNAGVRPLPLSSFYPGDRFVDVIGVDAYDDIATAYRGSRARAVLGQPDGLLAVKAFAREHGKPLSVPEWGIGPAAKPGTAGADGDDPAYVAALARVLRTGSVLYEGYFAGGVEGPQLLRSPRSLAVYRRAFGG